MNEFLKALIDIFDVSTWEGITQTPLFIPIAVVESIFIIILLIISILLLKGKTSL